MWYVYILQCRDNKLYTGCTQNIQTRLEQHNNGYVKSTLKRRPVTLLSYTVFTDKYKAYLFEKYLKTGSGRAFAKRHFI
ncbi:MAG: GIY-YIG nuclease family protein [Bacteroidota bacterium]